MKEGVCLNLYMDLNQKHHGVLLYEWILTTVKKEKFLGATVFKAIAGCGKSGKIKEEHFVELGGKVPVMVSLVVTKEQKTLFLSLLDEEKINLFFTESIINFSNS